MQHLYFYHLFVSNNRFDNVYFLTLHHIIIMVGGPCIWLLLNKTKACRVAPLNLHKDLTFLIIFLNFSRNCWSISACPLPSVQKQLSHYNYSDSFRTSLCFALIFLLHNYLCSYINYPGIYSAFSGTIYNTACLETRSAVTDVQLGTHSLSSS